MLRVVFDTNVVVSSQISRGVSYRCWMLAQKGLIQLIHCDSMLAELSDKLRQKLNFSLNDVRGVMFDYRRVSDRVEIAGTLDVVSDPDDNQFIECAIVGKANMILSLDHHLLSLGSYEGIPIIKPNNLLAQLSS